MALLRELLTEIEYACVRGTLDREVTDIIYDSRQVVPGSMFVCIPGAVADGHRFAAAAVEAGAGVLLVEKEMELTTKADVTVIKVPDTRYAMAFLSAAFFGHPAKQMKIIGITGTKGKSTTSSLIYRVLQEQNINSMLLGNIGVPVFDYIDKIKEDMTLVLEMSSHQLEYMELSPNISILLNVYPEHLDYYESFEKYADAKCNIYRYQKDNDYLLYNSDNEMLSRIIKKTNGKVYKVSFKGESETDIYLKEDKIYFEDKPIYYKNEKRNLDGDYNLNNIMFVLGVSEILHLDISKTINSISEFKTLEHRLELVGEYEGVLYYDNSIGTIPKATIEAVETLKCVDTLIIGGMDRRIDYSEFINYLDNSNIVNIICMPKTGHDIAKRLKNKNAYIVQNMEEAVNTAKKVTAKGRICLLSPAAASYGFFKNFEEKGNLYKDLVRDT